jgi:hypothetical protein
MHAESDDAGARCHGVIGMDVLGACSLKFNGAGMPFELLY